MIKVGHLLSCWRLEGKHCGQNVDPVSSDKRKKCMKATIKQIYGTLR